ETGYVLKEMTFAGILHAYREGGDMEYLSHYFVCRDFEGERRASDEGEPFWADIEGSLSLPGVHPFYVRLLPDIVKGAFPIEVSAAL
ncbi:MAG: hypothetical protein LBL51_00705, partial [Synergistaceae bacterium]|nr:hypothetical protein [Synergistaceae bacterium]